MFESLANAFMISFREGIEASLVVMTVLVVLRRRKDVRMKRITYAAVALAVLICSLTAYLLGTIALVNNPELEVALYGAAAVAVATMVVWMMRVGKKLKVEIESKIDGFGSSGSPWAMTGLFLFVFFMVAREGFELALFLLAFGSGIGGGYYVLSMLLGLGASIGFSYLLSRGILRINVGNFLRRTAVVLMLLVVQLVIDFLHEGMESGIVPEPQNQSVVNTIDYLSHDMPLFSYAAIALFMIIIGYYVIDLRLRRAKTAVNTIEPAASN